MGRLTTSVAGADGVARTVVDYPALFMVPTGMALAAVVLRALFFRPPTRGPVAADAVSDDTLTPSVAAPH